MAASVMDTKTINVASKSTLLSTIEVSKNKIIRYTLKDDLDLAGKQTVSKLDSQSERDLKLEVAYKTDDNKMLTLIHKYCYVYDDLLCWIYSFKHRKIYSYLNGAYMGSSTALPDLTIDDI